MEISLNCMIKAVSLMIFGNKWYAYEFFEFFHHCIPENNFCKREKEKKKFYLKKTINRSACPEWQNEKPLSPSDFWYTPPPLNLRLWMHIKIWK